MLLSITLRSLRYTYHLFYKEIFTISKDRINEFTWILKMVGKKKNLGTMWLFFLIKNIYNSIKKRAFGYHI